MFDKNLTYQLSIFFDLSKITPTSKTIYDLLGLFKEEELIPGTFNEIIPPNMIPAPRISLSSPDGLWVMNFASLRLDIIRAWDSSEQKNNISLEEFIPSCMKLYQKAESFINKKAVRIAINTHSFMPEMTQTQLEEIFNKWFIPLDYLKNNLPHEWNSRFNNLQMITINEQDEKINIINHVNRVQGRLLENNQLNSFDLIEVMFDINTYQEDLESRFDTKGITQFLDSSAEIINRIGANINAQIT